LTQNPAKTFLFDRDLTFWDSLYRDMTGITGLLSYCIHMATELLIQEVETAVETWTVSSYFKISFKYA